MVVEQHLVPRLQQWIQQRILQQQQCAHSSCRSLITLNSELPISNPALMSAPFWAATNCSAEVWLQLADSAVYAQHFCMDCADAACVSPADNNNNNNGGWGGNNNNNNNNNNNGGYGANNNNNNNNNGGYGANNNNNNNNNGRHLLADITNNNYASGGQTVTNNNDGSSGAPISNTNCGGSITNSGGTAANCEFLTCPCNLSVPISPLSFAVRSVP